MSSVIDGPLSRASTAAAQRLRTTMAAVRVSLSWFGTGKTLTAEQKQEAAEPFSADARFLSAGKRLLDVSHPAYKAVTAVRGKMIAYWKSMSLPYPEPGTRGLTAQAEACRLGFSRFRAFLRNDLRLVACLASSILSGSTDTAHRLAFRPKRPFGVQSLSVSLPPGRSGL